MNDNILTIVVFPTPGGPIKSKGFVPGNHFTNHFSTLSLISSLPIMCSKFFGRYISVQYILYQKNILNELACEGMNSSFEIFKEISFGDIMIPILIIMAYRKK